MTTHLEEEKADGVYKYTSGEARTEQEKWCGIQAKLRLTLNS